MERADISMPITKGISAIGVAAAAKADVVDQIAAAATGNSSANAWGAVNAIPWGTIASILAAAYTALLIGEWLWKKLLRPLAERRRWVKPRKRYIITLDDLQEQQDTDRAPL